MGVCVNVVVLFLLVTTISCGRILTEEKSSKVLRKTDDNFVFEKLRDIFYTNINNILRTFDASPSISSRKMKGKGKKKDKKDLVSRILPMLIVPFLLQTAIIPMMLTTLKFMLLKSAFIGKIAIVIGLINMFTKSNNQGGLFTHNVNVGHHQVDEHSLHMQHYGYGGFGSNEYGAYINRRRRRRSV